MTTTTKTATGAHPPSASAPSQRHPTAMTPSSTHPAGLSPLALFAAAFSKRALGLMVGGGGLALIVAAGSVLIESPVVTASGLLVSALMLFYVAHATGHLMLQEAEAAPGAPPPGALRSLRWSLAHGHRMLGVLLLVLAGVSALGTLGGLVLMLCKVPAVGPTLYAFLYPLLVFFFGAIILMGLSLLVLAAPALWRGHGAILSLKALVKALFQQGRLVFAQLASVAWPALIAFFLMLLVLILGSGLTQWLSGMLLLSPMDVLLQSDQGFALANNIGIGVSWIFGLQFPLLVAMAALCRISLAEVLGPLPPA